MQETVTESAGALETSQARPAKPRPDRLRAARHQIELVLALTIADLKVRYGRGSIRFVKWLVDPFVLVGVYLVLVAVVLDRPGEAPGLSLTCSVIPFTLVTAAVTNALGAVALRRSVVLNMGFNRSVIPLSGTLTETLAFGASLLLIVFMMVVYEIPPTVAILWLPVAIAVNLLFAVAVAYPASLIGLWMPDLKNVVSSAVRILYFVAPGLVPLSQVSPDAQDLLQLNPLTGLFEAYRAAVLYGRAPALMDLLYPTLFAGLLLAVFLPIYRAEQRHFAKIL